MATSKRKKKQRQSTIAGYFFITFSVLALIGILGSGFYFMSQRRPIDQATNCPTNYLDHVTAVLIDLTDPLTKQQEVALKNALEDLRDKTPKYGRVDLYTISAAAGNSRDPLFSLCSPGSGAQVESDLTGNKALADRIWKKEFGDKITAAIAQASRHESMTTSPIFEALQFVGVRTFGVPIVRESKVRRLVIISDLIHHTPEFSQYRAPIVAHAEFRKSQYYTRIKPQLQGATVDFYVLFRDTAKNVQRQPLQEFWYEHVREGGGSGDRWVPLQ